MRRGRAVALALYALVVTGCAEAVSLPASSEPTAGSAEEATPPERVAPSADEPGRSVSFHGVDAPELVRAVREDVVEGARARGLDVLRVDAYPDGDRAAVVHVTVSFGVHRLTLRARVASDGDGVRVDHEDVDLAALEPTLLALGALVVDPSVTEASGAGAYALVRGPHGHALCARRGRDLGASSCHAWPDALPLPPGARVSPRSRALEADASGVGSTRGVVRVDISRDEEAEHALRLDRTGSDRLFLRPGGTCERAAPAPEAFEELTAAPDAARARPPACSAAAGSPELELAPAPELTARIDGLRGGSFFVGRRGGVGFGFAVTEASPGGDAGPAIACLAREGSARCATLEAVEARPLEAIPPEEEGIFIVARSARLRHGIARVHGLRLHDDHLVSAELVVAERVESLEERRVAAIRRASAERYPFRVVAEGCVELSPSVVWHAASTGRSGRWGRPTHERVALAGDGPYEDRAGRYRWTPAGFVRGDCP